MDFRCELINQGIVEERFVRSGDSAEAVREELELFQWPAGEWRITKLPKLKEHDEWADEPCGAPGPHFYEEN